MRKGWEKAIYGCLLALVLMVGCGVQTPALGATAALKVSDVVSKGPIADVRAFGAKTDGTDQAAAVQATINASEAIYIPEGVYYDRSALTGTATKLIVDDSRGMRVTNRDFWWKPEPEKFELIAHRGFRTQAPENTLTAFSNAIAIGADSLECDVQISSDGVPVVIHDSTVDRTTDGTGNVKDQTLAQLQALDAGSHYIPIFATSRISTFADFLQYAKGRALRVYPEIKGYRTQADISLMVQTIVDAGMEEHTVFQSFNLSDLQSVRSINKRIGVGFLGSDISQLDNVAKLGGRAYMLLSYSSVLGNPTWPATIRAKGVDIAVWTPNRDKDVQQLLDLGVTKVMSDTPVYSGLRTPGGVSVVLDPKWAGGWSTSVAGTASVSVDADNVLQTIDSDILGVARKEYVLLASGGDVLEIEVWARAASGIGHLWVDSPDTGNLLSDQDITDKEFRRHVLRVVVPWNKGQESRVRIGFGTYTAEQGDVFYYGPKIRTTGNRGAPQVLAWGLIRIPQGGTPEIRDSYTYKGVASLALDADASTIIVTLATATSLEKFPILTAVSTPDNPKVVNAGMWANGPPATFKIGVRNFDGTKFIYNSGGDTYIYFKVER